MSEFIHKPEITLEMKRMGGERDQTVTRIEWRYESRCLICGFEISKDSTYCGECTCEEDSL